MSSTGEMGSVRRKGIRRFCLADGVPLEAVVAALRVPGERLKRSKKAEVRRVDNWVVKKSSGMLRHTFQRRRRRRAWQAAKYLHGNGVFVPAPIAYVERGFAGIGFSSVCVSEYLDGYRNVEDFLRALTQRGVGHDTIAVFLAGLGDAVNSLTAAGAYHADLSGKNIFTRDGDRFCFIDLDAVELDTPYDDGRRMKNHVQLYDSFCDQLNDSMLVPLITRMLTPQHDPRVWMPAVREGQERRRVEFEARRQQR